MILVENIRFIVWIVILYFERYECERNEQSSAFVYGQESVVREGFLEYLMKEKGDLI